MEITIEKTTSPKTKPDQNALGFGKYFTDHMFIMDYEKNIGWHNAKIIPYQPIPLDPATAVFHYGQAIFEGLKAYRTDDNRILLFRPSKNMERINITNQRMCMPDVDVDFCVNAIKEIVRIDQDWIPSAPGTALYIRPFIIATDPYLGVRASQTYKFMIILSPVGAYYPQGMNPVNIYVEPDYVRAVRGGTGDAKTCGNYAASLKAQERAAEKGYVQVLWLDGVEKKYIEEVGSMNVFFKINGEIITPALGGSILPGITRASVIHLLKAWGLTVTERKISMDELYQAYQSGILEEAFGTGTAAVISPIGELSWNGENIELGKEVGELAKKVYDTITGIQTGKVEDAFGWIVEVE
ncbi:branched chain amino acid aminotransferase [Desulfuribacillus stibiiarsenatis]|uniref:Branched-chain-amino-acid aminotransferase n=1 Tax=Desulfuribacillus stibiiarsenatis TaxID=1390249 RepID=A0A1E5L344_9FIRM|nr:branched-chain amino acid aminotransferase [Desulfuribacillus stibiiarsenatis]OEH84542.1 branched chain amino acid aminotransferase [Desulfuribacillus stibiiarsenatis]